MSYIDGFVLAVPEANKDLYLAQSRKAWEMFRDFGALQHWECWGDDVPAGKVTSFPMAVKKAEGEAVVFSWIEWPDRETRDRAYKAMESDERSQGQTMPFDGTRMIYGGFVPLMVERA